MSSARKQQSSANNSQNKTKINSYFLHALHWIHVDRWMKKFLIYHKSHNFTLTEAVNMVQNWRLWVMLRTLSSQSQKWCDDDNDDCIGITLGKLSHVVSRSCKIFIETFTETFIETFIETFTEFFIVRKFREILNYYLLIRISESSNFTLPFINLLKCTSVNTKKNLTVKV